MIWVLVALGGAAGSLLRYGVGRLAVNYLGPSTVMGTLAVNITGSLALGFFITVALERVAVPVEVRGLVAIGLLGGYTTFSTFSFETVQLLQTGEVLRAGASVVGNLVIGLGAAYLGIMLARLVWP